MSDTRTAKATKARRRMFLERKADEYAAALRELGYTVIAPGEAKHRARITLSDPTMCVVCGGSPTDPTHHDGVASDELRRRTAAYEEATDQCGCLREPLGHSRTECPSFVAPESEAVRARCFGCPDPEACSQGGCHLDGGPVKPCTACGGHGGCVACRGGGENTVGLDCSACRNTGECGRCNP